MNKFCWNYSKNFDPPAPIIEVVFLTPDEKLSFPHIGTIPLLVDSGYDGYVLIPDKVFNWSLNLNLYLAPVKAYVEHPTGIKEPLKVSRGIVQIPKAKLKILTFLETYENCEETLAGRRFLNQYKILLNGPEEKTCFLVR